MAGLLQIARNVSPSASRRQITSATEVLKREGRPRALAASAVLPRGPQNAALPMAAGWSLWPAAVRCRRRRCSRRRPPGATEMGIGGLLLVHDLAALCSDHGVIGAQRPADVSLVHLHVG